MMDHIVSALKRFGSFLSKVLKSPIIKTIVTGSIGGATMGYFLPLELAVLFSCVLLFHEFSHYLTALIVNAKPQLPFFIPLGFAIIGITKVKGIKTKDVRLVALSGPIVGAFVSLTALLLGLVLGSSVLVIGASCSLVFEVYSGTLGSDGAKARKIQKMLTVASL